MRSYQAYIDGKWTDAEAGATFESLNPYTGKPWARIARCSVGDVDAAITAAKAAFERPDWRDTTPSQRGALLRRVGDLIAEHAEHLAEVETTDNGKLLAEMRMQLRYMPQWYYYYAGLADKIEGSVPSIDKKDMLTFIRHEPLGVIVAFPSWNSAIMNLSWKLAPALAAGNTIVIKPSEHASASIVELMHVFEKAGFPKGVINLVTGFGSEIGDALVSHPDVAKVSFTGGEATAIQVGQAASRNLAPTVFELGGKSANIVFADANMDNAVKGVVAGIFAACGQSCVAGSRALVARPIYDEFIERVAKYTLRARMGDPMSADTHLGPMGTLQGRDKVMRYVQLGQEEGAELVIGGKVPDGAGLGDGWFVEPTIFSNVRNRMRIAQDEIFGPVLSVIPFDNEDEALFLANDVPSGLAGGVWTTDTGRAIRASHRLRVGMVWINTYRAVSYMMPFGGMKRSGYGRENGQAAIEEFLQTKSYWLNYAQEEPEPFVMR